MDRNPVSLGKIALATVAFALPGWLALALLVLWERLAVGDAIAAAVVVLAAAMAATRAPLANWSGVVHWTRQLALGAEGGTIKPREGVMTGDLVAAIGQMWRAWRRDVDILSARNHWHQELFAGLPDPLILLSEGRRITGLNGAAREAFGRDLAGRDLSVVLRAPEVLEAAEEVLRGVHARATEFTLPGPVERTFVAHVQRLEAPAEDGTRAVLALHDITAERRIEQMRADFVANASHELRTPLATLLGFIETLQGPAHDDAEARDRFLTIMQDQASRMARLVRDLLSLSRIELNEHSAPKDRVELVRVAAAAAEALHPIAQSRAMTIESRFGVDAVEVLGQDDELTQLIQNLLENALKYGREGTPVTITVDVVERPPATASMPASGRAVIISVADRGEGIGREHLPRLTERFYRVDPARSRSLGGTGLGLAIVKHIVNRHRGALLVESTLGSGSVFSVYLPLAPTQVESALAKAPLKIVRS